MGKGPARFDAVQALLIASSPVKGCDERPWNVFIQHPEIGFSEMCDEDCLVRVGTRPEKNPKPGSNFLICVCTYFFIDIPLSLYVIMRFEKPCQAR